MLIFVINFSFTTDARKNGNSVRSTNTVKLGYCNIALEIVYKGKAPY